ncbi:MAG: FAD-dependent oxidoreductase [Spirochaetales bacterium]|uniref:FAD-dependent oxidoreductase n=1 Tax=Candidatus Thalassospirochaeta sargassi TaxID=3119039 RepID=A0AAJ1IF77_9SPIO|nr:FAD-dependent oxidoreductase [Spirochaetales bacterium]
MKILIIGGVAGGASAAARLRRLDEDAEIIMFEKGPYISYANCGLPYYISETISERDNLLLQTPESFNNRFNVDVRVLNEVLKIDREAKSVTVVEKTMSGEIVREYTENYDKLILSPGSTPMRPPIPGIERDNVHTLWTVPDADKMKSYLDDEDPCHAVVVGGGFIGLELAENLVERNIQVTLVEAAPQVMMPLDFEMAQIVHRHLHEEGVDLHLGSMVKSFEACDEPRKTAVVTGDGFRIEADIIMLAIGVQPQTALAKDAGLELNQRGGIIVDSKMTTSDPDIFAVGDAVEVNNYMTDIPTMIPLAGPANKQGRMAAANVLGGNEEYKGTMGTSIVKIFDITAGSTGLNEKALKAAGKVHGKDYLFTMGHSKSHAGYYPGAFPLDLKMIFDPTSRRVLGAQVVGWEGVDKRIDVLATLIRMGGSIDDLTELELAYAPPYSSAKDPVNMAGFVAENMLEGLVENVNWNELGNYPDAVLLDVRDPEENELGEIPGSILVPLYELRKRLDELDKDKQYIVYCATGIRAYIAVRMMKQHGFKDARNLAGGFSTWQPAMWNKADACGVADAGLKTVNLEEVAVKMADIHKGNVVIVDACGLSCPGPIKKVAEKIAELPEGDVLEVHVTDPGFKSDIASWCKRTGNTLLNVEKKDKAFVARIRKGDLEAALHDLGGGHQVQAAPIANDKTMVCFSGDLDKAIASFIIANGALAMGRKVTMFFTFWGLNIIRKTEKVPVKKDFVSKMFGGMMPRGADNLKLSQMNMGGAGAGMIKGLMKKHNVPMLEELIQQAIDGGANIIACTMSMDLMGIKSEELIDGIEYGGVAAYLDAAEDANVNLFI